MLTVNAYSKKKDGNSKLTQNFRVKEFVCSDGSDPIFISPELVSVLQNIRAHFGKPVTITSAYRTPAHNKKVGGVTDSMHLYGAAADITVKDISPEQVAQYAEKLLTGKGGIGVYKTFVHIDVRSTKARWNG